MPEEIKRIVAGITGKKGSGKSLAAKRLVEHHGFTRMSFSEPLKNACQILFGFRDIDLNGSDANKCEVSPFLGVSARELLQYLGTDVLRNSPLFSPENKSIFVELIKIKIQNHKGKYTNHVVIDDVRFSDEIEMLQREFDAKIFHVSRNVEQPQTHCLVMDDTPPHPRVFIPQFYSFDPLVQALAYLGIREHADNLFAQKYDALLNTLDRLPERFPYLPYLGSTLPSSRDLNQVFYKDFKDFWGNMHQRKLVFKMIPWESYQNQRQTTQTHSSEIQLLHCDVPIENNGDDEDEFYQQVDLIPPFVLMQKEMAKEEKVIVNVNYFNHPNFLAYLEKRKQNS